MTDRLLELQLELLLVRHGRRAVIQALAVAGKMTPEALEAAIANVPRRTKKKSAPPTAEELVQKAFARRQDSTAVVQQLLAAYENRAFLPQLRDVQRFVDRAGVARRRLKSRAAATGPLIEALATMSDPELRQLVESGTPAGSNDFEMLAHEIMGGAARRGRQ